MIRLLVGAVEVPFKVLWLALRLVSWPVRIARRILFRGKLAWVALGAIGGVLAGRAMTEASGPSS
jgi:hypothetical protein